MCKLSGHVVCDAVSALSIPQCAAKTAPHDTRLAAVQGRQVCWQTVRRGTLCYIGAPTSACESQHNCPRMPAQPGAAVSLHFRNGNLALGAFLRTPVTASSAQSHRCAAYIQSLYTRHASFTLPTNAPEVNTRASLPCRLVDVMHRTSHHACMSCSDPSTHVIESRPRAACHTWTARMGTTGTHVHMPTRNHGATPPPHLNTKCTS